MRGGAGLRAVGNGHGLHASPRAPVAGGTEPPARRRGLAGGWNADGRRDHRPAPARSQARQSGGVGRQSGPEPGHGCDPLEYGRRGYAGAPPRLTGRGRLVTGPIPGAAPGGRGGRSRDCGFTAGVGRAAVSERQRARPTLPGARPGRGDGTGAARRRTPNRSGNSGTVDPASTRVPVEGVEAASGSDVWAILQGKISVSPLETDLRARPETAEKARMILS